MQAGNQDRDTIADYIDRHWAQITLDELKQLLAQLEAIDFSPRKQTRITT